MRKHLLTLFALTLALFAAGCGGDNAVAPQYQPQVVNTPNVVFTFQATGLQDVTDVLSYNWSSSSGSIVIHPATATTSGTIILNIKDASGAVVYDGTVPSSGDITPADGDPGIWTIRLSLANYTGTINFEVQMQ